MALTVNRQCDHRDAFQDGSDRIGSMTIDVIDLRDFYSQRLGIVARRLINAGIQARWPHAARPGGCGDRYPDPLLGPVREDARALNAFMPRRRAC